MDSTITQILSGLVGVGIVLMIAPRVLAVNQGKILKNIAIWVGVFLLLALVYKTYGPEKLGRVTQTNAPASQDAQQSAAEKAEQAEQPEQAPTISEEQGFMPPREE